jgi:hypothetical protein
MATFRETGDFRHSHYSSTVLTSSVLGLSLISLVLAGTKQHASNATTARIRMIKRLRAGGPKGAWQTRTWQRIQVDSETDGNALANLLGPTGRTASL